MPPQPLAYLYTSRSWLESLLSIEGVNLRLDDDQSGVVETSPEENYLTYQGINIATARVNGYCLQIYDALQLANSWEVWDWATIVGARWICSRRCNPIPESIMELYEEAITELKEIRANQRFI